MHLFRCSPRSFFSSRFSSSAAYAPSASTIANRFLTKCQAAGPQTRTQALDANQLQLFSLTLNRNHLYSNTPALSNAPAPPVGTPVPPGYHLVYFTPAFLESELGSDGTDLSYNPDAPFTRRMWAGGEVQWPRAPDGRLNLLRVGQEVREMTKFLSAEAKVIKKTGEEMIIVGLEKVFENEHGVALTDRRSWVFRPALKVPSPSEEPRSYPPLLTSKPPAPPSPSSPTTKVYTRNLRQTPESLFRMSALTFNGHKIHYSVPWAREVEGHRGLVVHGPLNLVSILDFWRDAQEHGNANPEDMLPLSISYRATNPLYAGEEYQICLEMDGEYSKANIYNAEGVVCMKAEIKGPKID
ncbi:hypothetical protein LOZ12_000984 [Ophidiomyces ophidiicola]|uniref:Uncharacterized protein n=1 Tax=Ophidiomyces ophidiicola TaxID=1387563 RepID=A0ACB8V5K5_9EURO|nr:hypothetical protein LOZ62_004948 [Ophidiomyces ophidiicola]KAI1969681.1 hypothetical protein LOZ56_004252 [Ophidiomyces ophidiicola]KAI1999789.1 hypothetical protein LOZ50_006486 [Ophidiomyces ophidiicola]KAI2025933.1 hypothetical protein LOZ45_003178 [Ophidiomyces ophidiicola]KAI2035870.1 hypothetical protein LOZ47_004403 [Ophidiomyces ophidiicola]